jgi:hypothetical protein
MLKGIAILPHPRKVKKSNWDFPDPILEYRRSAKAAIANTKSHTCTEISQYPKDHPRICNNNWLSTSRLMLIPKERATKFLTCPEIATIAAPVPNKYMAYINSAINSTLSIV